MAEQAHSIEALPEPVFTETLPEGVLFVGPDGVLYQVVLAEGAGFRKAEQWPWSTSRVASEHRQPVALVPGSFLARNYPVVEKGRRLPTLTRSAFIDTEGQPAHFAFPDEQLAKFAAQLDSTLTPQSGLTAYPENQRWLLGDGQHIYRVYHYAVSITGSTIDLAERSKREHLKVRDCRFGPSYWQYLPGWKKPAPPIQDTERAATALSASPTPLSPDTRPSEETSEKPIESVTPPVPVPPVIRTEATTALPITPPGPAAAQPIPVAPVAPAAPPVVSAAPPVVSAAAPDRSAERRFDFRSLFGRRTRGEPEEPNHPQPTIEPPPPVEATASPAVTMPEPLVEPATNLPEPPAPALTETIPSVPADEPSLSPALQIEPNPAAPIPGDESDAMAASKSRKSRRPLMMVLSVDIGYGYTKGVGGDGVRFSFPSVIGTAEDIRFAANLINGTTDRPVKFNEAEFFYGDQAVLQSRMQSTIFDRSRVHDLLYKMLFVAALVETHKQAPDIERLRLVTGLPVEFFNDRADVVSLFEGTYEITTDHTFRISVESVFVAPQPFGSLFRELLNDQGRITNTDVEKGRVGVIDIGTYTTDFIVADELRYVQRLSGSARIGWSKVINKVEQALGDAYGLDLTPHQVDRALSAGEVRVRGTAMPLKTMMDPAIDEVRAAIIARARDMWGEGVSLDTILVTGGGAAQLYELIREVYPHARLLDDAFWANAEGLYRFGRRPATFKE